MTPTALHYHVYHAPQTTELLPAKPVSTQAALHTNKATAIMLVHGFPVDHRMWDACAEAIMKRMPSGSAYELLAADMPGAGATPPLDTERTGLVRADGAYPQALDAVSDAYVALLRARGYQQAVWVGLSMGGYVVLDVQRRHPEAVAGMVLCDTKAQADDAAAQKRRFAVAEQCEREGNVEAVMSFAQPQPTDSTVKRSAWYERLMSAWIRQQRPEGVAWRERMAAGRPDLTPVLQSITAPVALVSGELDPSSPPERMRTMLEQLPHDATLTSIADCGHFSAVEHPDAVAQAIVKLVMLTMREKPRS